jgi:S1-C subfamily serine protease
MRLPGRDAVPPFLSALLFFLVAVSPSTSALAAEAEHPTDPSPSVVKLYVAAVMPDAFAPWRPGFSSDSTGSGAVIEGRRILTNAHVVEGHSFVQVRLHGSTEKHPARVTFVSHVADLALVEPEDPALLARIPPLALGDLPAVRDDVAALGFPTGGDTLSITKGVVTRVEHVVYVHSWERLLAIQMDAAIAPGNSGGPLVNEGTLVGVAVQSSGANDTLGCAVAVPVVRQFLEDVADGHLDGVPTLRTGTQRLLNPALKASLGVPEGEHGVLVRTVAPASPAAGVLQPGDVIAAVDGLAVADDGTVELRGRERTELAYGIDRHQVGDTVRVRYLRDGAAHEGDVTLTLARGQSQLVPALYEEPGDYYIFGGLVFLAVTRGYLMRSDEVDSFAWSLTPYLLEEQPLPNEQVVLLQSVLTAAVNQGYDDAAGEVIRKVDGQPVKNLRELVTRVEEGDAPYVTFEYAQGGRVTLDREEARRATPQILRRHGIANDRSASLRAQEQLASSRSRP